MIYMLVLVLTSLWGCSKHGRALPGGCGGGVAEAVQRVKGRLAVLRCQAEACLDRVYDSSPARVDEEAVKGPLEVRNVVLLSDCRNLQRKRRLLQQAVREMLPCMMSSYSLSPAHGLCANSETAAESPYLQSGQSILKHPLKKEP